VATCDPTNPAAPVTSTTSSFCVERAHDCVNTFRDVVDRAADIVNTLNGPSLSTFAPYESDPPADNITYVSVKNAAHKIASRKVRVRPNIHDDDDDDDACAPP
jgi:hypothetical protein